MTEYTNHVRKKKFLQARQGRWPSDEEQADD